MNGKYRKRKVLYLILYVVLFLTGCGARDRMDREAALARAEYRHRDDYPVSSMDNGSTVRRKRDDIAREADANVKKGSKRGSNEDADKEPALHEKTEKNDIPEHLAELYYEVAASLKKAEYPAVYETNYANFLEVYRLIENDPAFFWIRGYQVVYTFDSVEVYFVYTHDSEDKINSAQEEIDRAASEFLNGIPENANDFEKALYLHDWLIDRITYTDDGGWNDQTLYGALVKGECVCAGISKAFTYLAEKAGLESDYIIGYTEEGKPVSTKGEVNHSWNSLILDGNTYYVDVTWDNKDWYDDNKEEYHVYQWFCLTYDQIIVTHLPEDEKDMPLSGSDEYNYFVYYSYQIVKYDYAYTCALLKKQMEQGKNVLSLCFDTEEGYRMAVDNVSAYFNHLGIHGSYTCNDEFRMFSIYLD